MAMITDTTATSTPQRESAQGGTDPHVAWGREAAELAHQLRAQPDRADLFESLCALRDKIAETPASTPAGIAEQVRLAVVCDQEGSTLEECEMTALRSALASLEPAGKADPVQGSPDAELFEAWRGYVAAARGLRACPDDDVEAHAPFYAAMDRYGECLVRTPARTPAGLAVKLRFAFTRQEPDGATYDFMLLAGPRPDDLLKYGDAALLWGVMEDAERLARAG